MCLRSLRFCLDLADKFNSQTARITDIETSAMKTEMRGHDNRIECAVFVPQASIPAVRELVALVMRFNVLSSCLSPC